MCLAGGGGRWYIVWEAQQAGSGLPTSLQPEQSLLIVEEFRAVRKIPSDKKILTLKAGI